MKKIDLGITYSNSIAAPMENPKPYYPSLRVEKEIGDFKVGDKIYMQSEGVVTETNESKDRCCYTIEVKKSSFSSKSKDFENMTDAEQRKSMEEDID